ncbi:MAG: hypothetical protein RL760_829 [Candidatus Eisenbacteria bacterium]
MKWFARLFQRRRSPQNAHEEFMAVARVLIVARYREIAARAGIAPTAATSDEQIMAIYQKVGTAFRMASEGRGEHLPAGVINRIVLKFYQVYETTGEAFMDEHLLYEIDKYLREGLRPEYRQEIDLMPGLKE